MCASIFSFLKRGLRDTSARVVVGTRLVMKIIKKDIDGKDGSGSVVLQAEEPEDMWHAYNLIVDGDWVRTVTMRKVITEGATGSVASRRVKMNLTLDVQKVDFDPQECTIRIGGQNRQENPHVRIGQFHTLELALHRNFTLTKPCWDTIYLERLDTACDVKQQADLAAVVMSSQGQSGLANVCLVTGHMTVVRAKIEQAIPRKRAGRSGHAKALERFYESILQALLRHVQFSPYETKTTSKPGGAAPSPKIGKSGGYVGDTAKKTTSEGKIKCLVIASPGYTSREFYNWLMAQCSKRDLKEVSAHKSKIVMAHSSSGHMHSLSEVFANPSIQSKITETKAMVEVKVLQDFFKMLGDNPARAYYSYPHCQRACEMGAISTLLVTDDLFRSCKLQERKQYVALVESVRDQNGTVHIFSSQHHSGKQLAQLSGVAAILGYDLCEIEDEIELVSSESETDSSDDEGWTHIPPKSAAEKKAKKAAEASNDNPKDDMMDMMF